MLISKKENLMKNKILFLASLMMLPSLISNTNTQNQKQSIGADPIMSVYVDSHDVCSPARIFSQVGIPFSKPYDGSGIRIGIIDVDPNDVNLESSEDAEEKRKEIEKHPYRMQSIICGENGIAPGAQCFIERKSKNNGITFFDCANTLIYNKHVDIILCSSGSLNAGAYYGETNLIDRTIFSNTVPFIFAAGNKSKQSNLISSYSLALNAISVGSIDKNGDFAHHNANEMLVDYYDKTMSPNILAPGELIYGFQDNDFDEIDYDLDHSLEYKNKKRALTGTSYAAPIVAGIAALLMQEFPSLKNDFGLMMSVLTNSATPLNDQFNIPEYGGYGFGVVNYQNARLAAQNVTTKIINEHQNNYTTLYQENINIPTGHTLNAETFVRFNQNLNLGAKNPASYDDIHFSTLELELFDVNSNYCVYSSSSCGNFTKLSYKNYSSYTNFRLRVGLLEKENYGVEEYYSYCKYVKKYNDDYIEITNGGTIDVPPTFTFSLMPSSTATYYKLHFVDFRNELVFTSSLLSSYETSYTLSNSEWDSLISIRGREYYVCLVPYFQFMLFGPIALDDQSKAFIFEEPSTFSNSIQILPNDWGIPEQYHFNQITKNYTFSDSNGNLNITTNRLRCGYIKKMYITLSPRRKNAGTAYFELLFDKPIYHWMVGVTMWKLGEMYRWRVEDDVLIQTFDQFSWNTAFDLMCEEYTFPETRKQVDRFVGEGPIWGLRIYAQSLPFGEANNGRICIDDIVLNTDNNNFQGFGSINYEPIVVNKEFTSNF